MLIQTSSNSIICWDPAQKSSLVRDMELALPWRVVACRQPAAMRLRPPSIAWDGLGAPPQDDDTETIGHKAKKRSKNEIVIGPIQ